MARVRERGEDIRKYILENIDKYPTDIAKHTAARFKITRQGVNKHLQRLVDGKALTQVGQTRARSYKLFPQVKWTNYYTLTPELAEDVVWRNDITPVLAKLPDNAMNIWHYGFTEMFNNAIDHSDGRTIVVSVQKTAAAAEMMILDDGVGIFKKIQKALGLLDEPHAILELSKGKVTTDPKHHSGEGIFFSSRAFDAFQIMSGDVFFSHRFGTPEDWITEVDRTDGTVVRMRLHNHTSRTLRKIFDQYSSGKEYGFNKTVVPVELAQYGNDKLISRSQAKRLLARVELFKVVVLDFTNVETVGQAFTDEIFRVFAQQHPEIELIPLHATSAVKRMIERAKSGVLPTEPGAS
jgi:anti-sigma regulatory factor (Ser/Thr protein kinase)